MAKTPIDNKTVLNTSLFTFLSSGLLDVILDGDPWHKNDNPWKDYNIHINPDKEANIPIGDRETVFLDYDTIELGVFYTNFFFLDLDFLGVGRTVNFHFQTTSDWSFSLTRLGNRNPMWNGRTPENGMNIRFLTPNAEKWGLSNVRNLIRYFDGYEEGTVLDFNFIIRKPNSYTIEVVDVIYKDANLPPGLLFEGEFNSENYSY